MNILNIKNEDLDALIMTELSKKINNNEHRGYFCAPSGLEHYRLLSYLSLTNDYARFLDIGTFKGCSGLAFSMNSNSEVYSFDVQPQVDLNNKNNVTFLLGDILELKHRDLIMGSKFILLDTMHDGTFEKTFYEYLLEIYYKGYLLLDDIHLNPEMKEFWDSINKEKHDITHIGHSTGTGLVIL